MMMHDLAPESKIAKCNIKPDASAYGDARSHAREQDCLIQKPVGVSLLLMANMPCSINAGGTAHNVAEEKRHYGS